MAGSPKPASETFVRDYSKPHPFTAVHARDDGDRPVAAGRTWCICGRSNRDESGVHEAAEWSYVALPVGTIDQVRRTIVATLTRSGLPTLRDSEVTHIAMRYGWTPASVAALAHREESR